jgi:DNA-binding SARP family transcriptional activator
MSIFLLGRFELTLNGASVTAIESDRGRALLAYLALEADHSHSREALAGLLWPDAPERAARQNLRQALYNLRRALDVADHNGAQHTGQHFLTVTPRDIQFNPASDHWLDVTAFSALLDACQAHAHRRLDACAECMDYLQGAVELYRGDFLAGFSLPDSDTFEEWRLFKQEELHRQAVDALSYLASYHERRHEYETAAHYLGRQLELEPWREEAHRQLMQVLALSGARSAALQQYEICRRILAEELGAKPTAETRTLYKRIKTGVLQPELIEADNPYKGLHTFTEADAGDFFGREAFVERLTTAVHRRPLVAVVGASGSGKSSVIRAGLLPRLRPGPYPAAAPQGESAEPETEARWLIADFRPGGDPFFALADALLPLIEPGSKADDSAFQARTRSTAQRLREGELPLVGLVDRILRQARGRHPLGYRLLLVMDHFEDLYTLGSDLAMCRAFLDLFLQPLASATVHLPNLVLLLSLRADFAGQALSYRPLADALQTGGLILGPMNRTELRRAIEEPARGHGVIFEPGLVGRLLDDAGNEPGNLPLLQFALTLLWERRVGGQLSHAAYEEIGGVAGALTSYADHVYEELTPAEQEGVRRIFLQMVHPGEGIEDTRRLATRDELNEKDWPLIQKLADARLLVTDQDPAGQETVEIVHEALIWNWGRLRAWMDEDRAFRTWQRRLRAALRAWDVSSRDSGALLRGALLTEAEAWAAHRADDLSPLALAFIATSLQLRDYQLAQAGAQRQHERDLEAAEGRAHRSQQDALALGKARDVRSGQLRQALSRGEGVVCYAEFSPDGSLVATASRDGTARVWDVGTGQLRHTLEHTDQVWSASFSPTGSQLVTCGEKGRASVWDVGTGRLLYALEGHTDTVCYAEFSVDGAQILTASWDGMAGVWDGRTGQLSHALEHAKPVYSARFSPDSSRVITVSGDKMVKVWDAHTGQELHTLEGRTLPVN